jgi:hypothetical protein
MSSRTGSCRCAVAAATAASMSEAFKLSRLGARGEAVATISSRSRRPRCVLRGLLSYLMAAVVVTGATTALLFAAVQPAVEMVAAQQETPKVAPRIQAWLDRKAEGLVYAEKEKVAAVSEKERVEELGIKIRSPAEYASMARAHAEEERQAAERASASRRAQEERQATERASAARSKNSAKREATWRSHQPEQTKAQTAAHGDAPGRRLSSRPELLHAPE